MRTQPLVKTPSNSGPERVFFGRRLQPSPPLAQVATPRPHRRLIHERFRYFAGGHFGRDCRFAWLTLFGVVWRRLGDPADAQPCCC